MRVLYDGQHDDGLFGSNSEALLLVMAVAVGQLEMRPMSAAKLADFVGIPRGTVIRKLAALIASGVVMKNSDKEFCIRQLSEQRPGWAKTIDAMERLVRSASTELSNLDT